MALQALSPVSIRNPGAAPVETAILEDPTVRIPTRARQPEVHRPPGESDALDDGAVGEGPVDLAPPLAADAAALSGEIPGDGFLDSLEFEGYRNDESDPEPFDEGFSVATPPFASLPREVDTPVAGSVPSFFSDRASAAEFETQSAILLSCHELIQSMPDVLGDVLESLCGRLGIIVLVAQSEERELVLEVVRERGLQRDSVTFLDVNHDTMWVRDYGPFVRRTADGSVALLDARYPQSDRANDDGVPEEIASRFNLHLVRVDLALDGGNLLSNGSGLCLSTQRLLDENDYSEPEVRSLLRTYFGCEETVFLEPLHGEETGHVDMFATFTSRRTVVLGRYDLTVDPENSALLDRNARRLGELASPRGGLDVVRIPMPTRINGTWPTYTNVLFANGRVLVPVYFGEDENDRAEAFDTYGRLLPGWTILPIDASQLVESGGALHCLAMNVPTLGPWSIQPRCGGDEGDILSHTDHQRETGQAWRYGAR